MSTSVLYGVLETTLTQLTPLVLKELDLAWHLDNDLKSLWETLTSIRAVLSDAEEQRFSNHRISQWLHRLRDALYAAEDVFDDFAYEALLSQVISSRGGIGRKIGHFCSIHNSFVFRFPIGHKIKEIRETLEGINTEKDQFNLNERVDHGGFQLREEELSQSLDNASIFIGRDKDREKIVELLIDSHGHGGDEHNVSVIPIVGIGGMGKTALAKVVYNDQRVVDHFDSKVWVCLGDMKTFDVYHVMAMVTGQTGLNDSNLEGLVDSIREKTTGKRVLVVLDDLWDADRFKWLEFEGMMTRSARGSKILVTTRDSSVAECVRTVPAYRLEALAHEGCVSLFKIAAFSSEAEVDESLMKIGDEIVRKCKGVPLAVKTLGGLLKSKRRSKQEPDEDDWKSVRDSGIWQISGEHNHILNILKLSYDHLPSHLKLCFVLCSVFPQDYDIRNYELISLWMAHGLLKEQDAEGVGEQYINQLVSRGFFQDFRSFHRRYSMFKMHDLLGDLARSLAEDECNGKHLWIDSRKQGNSANLSGHDQVRSAILYQSSIALLEAFSSKCRSLRLLWVVDSDILALPDSVGSLKYLRSLKLENCKDLKKLPQSICELYHLETLSLLACTQLEEIPENIGELVKLRWLAVTTKQKHLPKNGIESLTCLRVLQFHACPNLETLFQGTQIQLHSLKTLIVYRCERLRQVSGFASKHSFPALETLELAYCDIDDASEFLQIAPNLASLNIAALKRLETLSSSSPECARTLQHLTIASCPKLGALPEWLPSLSSLRTLSLVDCNNLVSLPQSMKSLTALKNLRIYRCGQLSQRCRRGQGEEWSKISHVSNVDFNYGHTDRYVW